MNPTLFIYCLLLLLLLYAAFEKLAPYYEASEAGCRVGYVYDGDTVELICGADKQTARLVGFDTPETKSPGCGMELALGKRATERLREIVLLGEAAMARQGYDKYGRILLTLKIDERDVAHTLIEEGLAVPYSGGKRINWCELLGE